MDESWRFLILALLIMGFAIYAVAKNENIKYQEQRKKEEELRKDPKYLEQRQLEFAKRQKMKAKLEEQNIAYCPFCLSTSIVLADSKKGTIKKATKGYLIAGGVGAIIASSNKTQERVCLKCGKRF